MGILIKYLWMINKVKKIARFLKYFKIIYKNSRKINIFFYLIKSYIDNRDTTSSSDDKTNLFTSSLLENEIFSNSSDDKISPSSFSIISMIGKGKIIKIFDL
jgi:hypothetical protein